MLMAMRGRSTLSFFAASMAACAASQTIDERPIVVYTLADCPITVESAYAVFQAEGDREPTPGEANASYFLRDLNAEVSAAYPEMRSVSMRISDASGSAWSGLSLVPSKGEVALLAWPLQKACTLSKQDARSGATLGAIGRDRLMLAGGTADGRVPSTQVIDLRTGHVTQLSRGLGSRRVGARITRFQNADGRSGALVSGGLDPESSAPLSDVEIYVEGEDATGDFEDARITLGTPRADHAAVELATGETVLVGGTTRVGATSSIEVVDGTLRRSRTSGVALLESARTRAHAVRLASGEIVVAGGVDGSGAPVARVEWLASDVSRSSKRSRDISPGIEAGLAPLSAGGALYVVKRVAETIADAWRIGADGSVTSAGEIQNVSRVFLSPAEEGKAVLFTGDRWLVFDPWENRFGPTFDLPQGVGPSSSLAASPDPGLVVWGESDGTLRGVRSSVRNAYSFVEKPLLASDHTHFAPDSAPGSRVAFRDSALHLSDGAAAFLNDVSFQNVVFEFQIKGSAPHLVFRDELGVEYEIGGAWCPWKKEPTLQVAIERVGTLVRVKVDGEAPMECPNALGASRISLGFRAPTSGEVGVSTVIVTRE